MLIPLHLIAPHALWPDYAPGAHFELILDQTGALMLTLPLPAAMLHRLAQAMHDGALVMGPHGPGPVDWDEADAAIMARRDELLAQLTTQTGGSHSGSHSHLAQGAAA